MATGSALTILALWESFNEDHVWFAMLVLFAFACIGLLMQRCRWPRLPLLFGLIFGPIVEWNSINAMARYDLLGALARPLVMALAAMVLAVGVLSYCLRKSGAPSGEAGMTDFRQPMLTALLQRRNIVPALGIAVGVAFWWSSLSFNHVFTWLLPRVAGLTVAALCLLELALSTRNQEGNAWPASPP